MSPRLSPDELIRYGRQLALPEIGEAGQRRLKSSSVLVVGVGGLGSPAATYLAAAGVGRLGLVDGDVIEQSNLHRQFLFSDLQVGQMKAEVAKARLSQVNPNTEVVSFPLQLDSSNAMETISGFDVVVDATDNLPSRYLISDSCVMAGKQDVYASALRFDGQASVFCAPGGPCYRCLYPQPPPPESVESCEEAGVLGAVPGVMGAVQAAQAISILLGKGSPLVGRLLVFSGLDSSFEELRIRKDPRCPMCGPNPTIKKLLDYYQFCGMKAAPDDKGFDIGPLELEESIRRGQRPLLLDVREPYEYEICHIKGAKLIPVGQIPRRMVELDSSRAIVVYCHHGVRSANVVRLLREAGYAKAKNLRGGIEAWRQQVDPDMRAY
jgi:molybdopterin/thiamine biosynthesis adenylyltransferase/rhodanese-related sulfurtransferase